MFNVFRARLFLSLIITLASPLAYPEHTYGSLSSWKEEERDFFLNVLKNDCHGGGEEGGGRQDLCVSLDVTEAKWVTVCLSSSSSSSSSSSRNRGDGFYDTAFDCRERGGHLITHHDDCRDCTAYDFQWCEGGGVDYCLSDGKMCTGIIVSNSLSCELRQQQENASSPSGTKPASVVARPTVDRNNNNANSSSTPDSPEGIVAFAIGIGLAMFFLICCLYVCVLYCIVPLFSSSSSSSSTGIVGRRIPYRGNEKK